MNKLKVQTADISSEAEWDYRESAPIWRKATFDPFPGYAHDEKTVQDLLLHLSMVWEPSHEITFFLPNREETGRTNGWSMMQQSNGEWIEDAEEKSGWRWEPQEDTGDIVFSAKRVPPMRAMTRHLVGHEYGHHVEWMINKARGNDYFSNSLRDEYLKMRGLSPDLHKHYGTGGRWHSSIHEIFACDFRIVLCGYETEHWPHEGIAHPLKNATVIAWWLEAQEWWATR